MLARKTAFKGGASAGTELHQAGPVLPLTCGKPNQPRPQLATVQRVAQFDQTVGARPCTPPCSMLTQPTGSVSSTWVCATPAPVYVVF